MENLYNDHDLVAAYDTLNTGRHDYEFYLARLPKAPCDILDVGCGTGRFALELAARGYKVTALDPSSAMIAFAKEQPGSQQVSWQVGTVHSIASAKQYDHLLMTGHAFQHLLTDGDILAFFNRAVTLLRPGGSLLFETRNPARRIWEKWRPGFAGSPRSLPDGTSISVAHHVCTYINQIVTFAEWYSWDNAKFPKLSWSRLRFATAAHLCNIAEQAGLSVIHVWGNWDYSQFDPDQSPEIILSLSA